MGTAVDQVSPEDFDVRSLNEDLNRSKRRLAVISVAFAVLLAAVALVFVVADAPGLLNGKTTGIRLLTFAVAAPVLLALVAVLLWGLRWKRPGAEWIRVRPQDLELRFSNRPPILLLWSDPRLWFELDDYSDVQSPRLSIVARYFVRIEGTDSALSPEAFRAIERQVDAHGLLEQVRPASQWKAPAGVAVHSIRARSS